MISQLPLNIHLKDDATFANFYGGNNQEILNAIHNFADGIGEPYLFVWGAKGAGKSHLLQAVCHEFGIHNKPCVYLPLKEWQNLSSEMLQNLDRIPLICLDDIHVICDNKIWEEAIFHAYNRIQMVKARLLISSEVSPFLLNIRLADLKSRLANGVTYHLQGLNDEEKLQALILKADARGFTLTESVAQFLLSRCTREMRELYSILEKLDHASLAQQRRLTIPFVKEVLDI